MSTKKENINYFVDKIDWSKVLLRWEIIKILPNRFETEEFKTYWRQNFKQRPGQVLINLGLISDGLLQWNDTTETLLETCYKN